MKTAFLVLVACSLALANAHCRKDAAAKRSMLAKHISFVQLTSAVVAEHAQAILNAFATPGTMAQIVQKVGVVKRLLGANLIVSPHFQEPALKPSAGAWMPATLTDTKSVQDEDAAIEQLETATAFSDSLVLPAVAVSVVPWSHIDAAQDRKLHKLCRRLPKQVLRSWCLHSSEVFAECTRANSSVGRRRDPGLQMRRQLFWARLLHEKVPTRR